MPKADHPSMGKKIKDTGRKITDTFLTKPDETYDVDEIELAKLRTHLNENTGQSKIEELRAWWLDTASREIEPLIDKMLEYGGEGRAVDLINIGRTMVESGITPPVGMRDADSSEEVEARFAELGIYFYLVGKFARWQAAIAEGRDVSDDTLHDIGIYVRMAQRLRAHGGWPW